MTRSGKTIVASLLLENVVIRILHDPAEANQEKIVEAGGLTSLLNLLRSSEDETIYRVAAGAIANLAMNGELSYLLYSCICPSSFPRYAIN